MIGTIIVKWPDGVPPPLEIVEEQLSPEEQAKANAQRARYERNLAWLEAHGQEVYAQHRGRHICVAGQELFVADTVQEVLALARAAHPEDDGPVLWYLSPLPGPRIYANQRAMAGVP